MVMSRMVLMIALVAVLVLIIGGRPFGRTAAVAMLGLERTLGTKLLVIEIAGRGEDQDRSQDDQQREQRFLHGPAI